VRHILRDNGGRPLAHDRSTLGWCAPHGDTVQVEIV
jgi:hypothetical protein